jgi:hypothetical protein
MHEANKLEEAEYFLMQMVSAAEDREAYKYNLSAFLSAARSVLNYAKTEAKQKSGSHVWLNNYESASPVVKFFIRRRDVNIHTEPVSPAKENQVHIEDTLHFSGTVEAVVIRNGTPVTGPQQQQSSRLAEGTNWPYPSKVTMSYAYRFSEWPGSEDLPTLCRIYLTELRRLVADGQSKGYLTR